MKTKLEAVKEIERTATTWHVKRLAQEALKSGDDTVLTHALVETKRAGTTLHVINIANEQLGYPNNHTQND